MSLVLQQLNINKKHINIYNTSFAIQCTLSFAFNYCTCFQFNESPQMKICSWNQLKHILVLMGYFFLAEALVVYTIT